MIMALSKQSLVIRASFNQPYIHLERLDMEFLSAEHKKEVDNT